MLLIFRRKLAPWAIIAILLLVFSVAHLTYNRDFAIGSVRSLIKGEAASSQDTETPADSATISHSSQVALQTKPATDVVDQQATQEKLLVVGKTKDEDTNWIGEKLSDWPTAIYTVDDPNAALQAKNKGHEASVYLTYIVENYDKLADVTVFIHSHRKHKHGTKRDRIFEGIDYDNYESIRALDLEFVTRNGFANLRCLNIPGCPAEIQPFRPEEQWDPLRPQERAMAAAWKELFQNDQVPEILAAPCCAQFAASKAQIQQRPKAEYERFQSWLYSSELDDATTGRIFEYLWHVVFGKDAVYCPEEDQCYANQYGTNSLIVHQYQSETTTQEGNRTEQP